MPYPNNNKLNIVISQTSASADSTGKFPFVETLISGSNLFLVTDAAGVLTGGTSIPNASFTNLTASNLLVTDNTTLGDSTTDLIKITGSLGLSGSFSTISASFSDLTANRVVYTDGNKILSTDDDLTFDGTTLTATNISNTNLTSSNISASGFISASRLRVETSIVDGGSLTVIGNTVLGDSVTDTTQITGSASISGSLTVVGTTTLQTLNLTNVSASGWITASSLNIVGNSLLNTITGSLSGSSISTGNATINGGTINNTPIGSTTPSTGYFTNLTASNISASNSIIDGGSLTVIGNTFLGDAITDTTKVTGSVSISGSLSVVGSITGTIDSALTASSINITNLPNTNATYYPTFVDQSGTAKIVYVDNNKLNYNPYTNALSLGPSSSGSLIIGDTAFNPNIISLSTDISTGASVSIGVGIGNVSSSLTLGDILGQSGSFTVQTYDTPLRNKGVSTDLPIITSNSTQATSWNNGALVVAGGVGIGKNLYVSGSTFLYGDLTIFGSSSIVNISSSTVIIGDNRILLNAGSPIVRYAGIDVYDSGSGGIQSNVTSSMLWDSLNNSWLIFSANSGSGTFTTSSAIIIGGPTGAFGSETTLTNNFIPKAQSSGKNITNSLLSDNGTTLAYTGTGISASQITSSNALYTNIFATNVSSSFITASNSQLTNVYSAYISSSQITSSNLRVQLTGSITYATGVLVTYLTGSFTTLTLSTGSFPGAVPGLVPTTPTSSGMPGQINIDNNFIYVYTNEVWKRVPLAQWAN